MKLACRQAGKLETVYRVEPQVLAIALKIHWIDYNEISYHLYKESYTDWSTKHQLLRLGLASALRPPRLLEASIDYRLSQALRGCDRLEGITAGDYIFDGGITK